VAQSYFGQGRYPSHCPKERVAQSRYRWRSAGRYQLIGSDADAGPVQLRGKIQRARRTPDAAVDLVNLYTALGVDELIINLPGGHAAMLQQMGWFAREVIPAIDGAPS